MHPWRSSSAYWLWACGNPLPWNTGPVWHPGCHNIPSPDIHLSIRSKGGRTPGWAACQLSCPEFKPKPVDSQLGMLTTAPRCIWCTFFRKQASNYLVSKRLKDKIFAPLWHTRLYTARARDQHDHSLGLVLCKKEGWVVHLRSRE